MTLEARDISVTLGERPALRAVDAELRAGEMLGLVGPNGAGKTTLLRVLAGLLKPDTGHVACGGTMLTRLRRTELARHIAFLGQGGDASWPLAVEALVALGRLPNRRPFGEDTERDRAAVARAMALCNVDAFAERPVGTLSGGERRRVLLARALAVEAQWLLADEPLAGLDPLHQLETMDLLRRIARGGTGVVVVLHDLSLAARFCDRLLLLNHGRLAAEGAPEQVLDDARLAEVFGISALRGRHDSEPFLLPWRAGADSARPR